MSTIRATKSGLAATAFATAILGLASANAATNTSSAEAPRLIDKTVLQFKTDIRGTSITKPLSSRQPGDFVQESNSEVESKNYLTLGYKLNDEVRLDAVAYWRWDLVKSHDFTWRDPYLRLRDTSFARFGEVNLYADARLIAPAWKVSRDQDMAFALAGQQVFSYVVPDSRLSFGLAFYEQYNIFSNKTVSRSNSGYHLELYTSPSVEYRINPTLAATAFYEFGGYHFVGNRFGLEDTYSAVQVGVSWDPSSRVNLSPYLELKTHGKVNLDTTQIGAALNLNIL